MTRSDLDGAARHPRRRGLSRGPADVVLPGIQPPGPHPGPAKADPRGRLDPAYDSNGSVRDGAWVAELTDLLDLAKTSGPPGCA